MIALCEGHNKRIILARHGQTVSNRDGFIMGRNDSPLTPEGERTAEQLASVIRKENPEAVYCSPLGRAVASAAIYTRGLQAHVFIREALAELSCGQWEKQRLEDVSPGSRRLRSSWQERPPGGESYQDAESRASAIIDEICHSENEETVLVVSHAGLNRVLLKLWLDLTPDKAIRLLPLHDIVFILDGLRGVTTKSGIGDEIEGLLFQSE